MYEMRGPVRGIAPVSPQAQAIFGNRLLDGLPREEAAKISPYIRRIFLHRGQELRWPEEQREFFYFPIDAFLWTWSDTTHTERPTSLLAVGRRGVVCLNKVFESLRTRTQNVVLSPGSAWRMHVAAFSALGDSMHSPLRRALSRFTHAAFAISCCRLACNSEHNVDKRLARWLLWIMDETGKPEVSLTHQQLADVAAIRRPSVSLAFSDLQRRGIVRVHHGFVQILDRERLERETCPCYEAISEIIEGALAPSSHMDLDQRLGVH